MLAAKTAHGATIAAAEPRRRSVAFITPVRTQEPSRVVVTAPLPDKSKESNGYFARNATAEATGMVAGQTVNRVTNNL